MKIDPKALEAAKKANRNFGYKRAIQAYLDAAGLVPRDDVAKAVKAVGEWAYKAGELEVQRDKARAQVAALREALDRFITRVEQRPGGSLLGPEADAARTALTNTEEAAAGYQKVPEGLSVQAKPDGTWLTFKASNGRTASLHVESIADQHQYTQEENATTGYTVIGSALKGWCDDQQNAALAAPTAKPQAGEGTE